MRRLMLNGRIVMRILLLAATVAVICCGPAEARYQWLPSDGLPCETVCRKPVMVGDNPNAYVCAGHLLGMPPGDIRSGMIGAGARSCYVPGEAPKLHTEGQFLCLCAPR
jgi:hypothetical protein